MAAPTYVTGAQQAYVPFYQATPIVVSGLAGVAAGDLVVLYLFLENTFAATATIAWPAGFTQVLAVPGIGAHAGPSFVAYGVASGGETSFTVQLTAPLLGGAVAYNSLIAEVYRGLGSAPVVVATSSQSLGGSASAALPTITPPAGKPAVLGGACYINPNYSPTIAAPWTSRHSANGGDRQFWRVADRLIDPTSGAAYGGELASGAGGETQWTTITLYAIPGGGTPPVFPRYY